MKGNPLVSVIINCYNSAEYLQEAIESVINQTYTNWEIVFWDNQSTDDSAAIYKKYNDDRLRYFYAPEHKKLSSARNMAVQKATGEYLAFLDCDDVWLPLKLEQQMRFFVNDDKVGLVYSQFTPVTNSDTAIARKQFALYSKFRITPHGPINLFDTLLVKNFIIFSTVILKKQIFLETGGFSDGLEQNEDYEILLKCSNVSLAACTTDSLVQYRIHTSNNSFRNAEKNFLENRRIYREFPASKNVTMAIERNEIRYGLFKLIYLKQFAGLKLLFRKKSFSLLYKIFCDRYLKKNSTI